MSLFNDFIRYRDLLDSLHWIWPVDVFDDLVRHRNLLDSELGMARELAR